MGGEATGGRHVVYDNLLSNGAPEIASRAFKDETKLKTDPTTWKAYTENIGKIPFKCI